MERKNSKIIILFLLFLAFFLNTLIVVKADSGWDSSYDSGGSSWNGGYSSGGSYGGGDYSSSSDYVSFLSPLEFIILAILGTILLIYEIISGIRRDSKKLKKADEFDKAYDYIDTTSIYKEMNLANIKDKNVDELKNNIFKEVEKLFVLYNNKDINTIKFITTTEFYNEILTRINDLTEEDRQEKIYDLILKDIRILEYDGQSNIKVYLNINCKIKIIDTNYNDVIKNDKINLEFIIYLDVDNENYIFKEINKVGNKNISEDDLNV